MRKFKTQSYHEVFEDDYQHGEIKNVNSYKLTQEVSAGTPQEAVTKYLQENIHSELSFGDCERDDVEIYVTYLVNADNVQATEADINAWEQGKIKLYSTHATLFVDELKEITFR